MKITKVRSPLTEKEVREQIEILHERRNDPTIQYSTKRMISIEIITLHKVLGEEIVFDFVK